MLPKADDVALLREALVRTPEVQSVVSVETTTASEE